MARYEGDIRASVKVTWHGGQGDSAGETVTLCPPGVTVWPAKLRICRGRVTKRGFLPWTVLHMLHAYQLSRNLAGFTCSSKSNCLRGAARYSAGQEKDRTYSEPPAKRFARCRALFGTNTGRFRASREHAAPAHVAPAMKIIAPIAATMALALAACATTPSGSADELLTVTGEATYRQRIALPQDAVITVRIEDVSRADAAATVLGEQTYATNGRSVPLPFEVNVYRSGLEDAVRTNARVTIVDGEGRLIWTTDTNHPVTATAGQDDIDLGTLVLSQAAG